MRNGTVTCFPRGKQCEGVYEFGVVEWPMAHLGPLYNVICLKSTHGCCCGIVHWEGVDGFRLCARDVRRREEHGWVF